MNYAYHLLNCTACMFDEEDYIKRRLYSLMQTAHPIAKGKNVIFILKFKEKSKCLKHKMDSLI